MKRRLFILIFVILGLFFSSDVAFAVEPTIVTGTERLINDGTTWILRLVPTAGVLRIAWIALQKNMDDDQEERSGIYTKKMKSTLKWTVIGESAVGIIALLNTYY